MKTVATATIVCLIFVFLSQFLLGLSHIWLWASTIAGGIVLLLVALHVVLGEEAAPATNEAMPPSDIAVYPIAMLLMGTPHGARSHRHSHGCDPEAHQALIVAAMVVIMGMELSILRAADRRIERGRAVVGEVDLFCAGLAIQLLDDLGLAPTAAESAQ